MKKAVFLFLITVLFTSCATVEKQKMFKTSGNGLGTTFNISYFSDQKLNLNKHVDSIFDVINSSLSTYHKDSDISKLNRGEDVAVDEHFIKVFKASQDIFTATEGYFDPSIGPLVNAYGFGPTKPLKSLDQERLDSLLGKVGFQKFRLSGNKIISETANYYLDFNAIAKGYAVDVIANHLSDLGLTDYFVELGGEIVAKGKNLDNDVPWRFGIEKPVEDNPLRDLTHAISLENKALATSGNYRKFRTDEQSGQKFVHTINPITGKAEKSNVLSASVVANDCMTADAYATSFMAMGFENSIKVIEKNQLSVLLIYVDDNNEVNYFNTKDLDSQISEIQ